MFGDSLSAGYGVPAGQSFPDDLQRKLDTQGYAWRVVNLGISGDTTAGAYWATARIQYSAIDMPAGGNAADYDGVLVYIKPAVYGALAVFYLFNHLPDPVTVGESARDGSEDAG